MDSFTNEQLIEAFEYSEVQKKARENYNQYFLVEYHTISRRNSDNYIYDCYASCNYKYGPSTPGIVVKLDFIRYHLYDEYGFVGEIRRGAFDVKNATLNDIHVDLRMLAMLKDGEWVCVPFSLEKFRELEW